LPLLYQLKTGGGILSGANTESKLKLGDNVIIVRLIVSILSFGFFVVVLVIFHKKILDNPTSTSLTTSVTWNRYLIVLYTASGLIIVRCVYRVVEYVQGQTGVLQSHEYYAYIFDTALVFMVMVICAIFHPSQVVRTDKIGSDETELIYT
jgi:ABC-type multidrug transport system fused ATPase/permease subunit